MLRAALTSGVLLLCVTACGGGGGASPSVPVTLPSAQPTASPHPTSSPTLPPSGSLLVAYAATPPPVSYSYYIASGNGYSIAVAADGVPYVSQNTNAIVRGASTPAVLTAPLNYGGIGFMTRGSDGAIWFSNTQTGSFGILAADAIGRVDASGTFSEYNLPSTLSSPPFGMALGPDGNVWFTEFYEGRIGKITPQGAISEFSLGSTSHRPSGIAAGPDGNVWVGEGAGTTIERVSPSGSLLATYNLGNTSAFHVTAGSDGAIWFVDASNGLGRIDMQGNIRTWQLPCNVPNVGNFCVPGYFQGATDITAGPDGALWFVAQNFQAIARITTAGILTEWPVPATPSGFASPNSLTTYGNTIFFTGGGNFIGKATP